MNLVKMIKKYKEKEEKKAAKEEIKGMIPAIRANLQELTSSLDTLNDMLKKITRL